MRSLGIGLILTGVACLGRYAIGQRYQRRFDEGTLKPNAWAESHRLFYSPRFWFRSAALCVIAGLLVLVPGLAWS